MSATLAKPLPGTPIRWGHPDAAGLRVAVPYNEGAGTPRDLVGGLAVLPVGTDWTWGTIESGPARRSPTQGGGSYDELSLPAQIGPSGAWTIALGFRFETYSGNAADIQGVFSTFNLTSNPMIRFGDSAGAGALQLQIGGGTFNSTTVRSVNTHYWLELTFDGSSAVAMYVNGVLDIAGTAAPVTWVGGKLRLGRDDTTSRAPLGYFTGARFYDRCRSAAEAKATAGDLYGVFARPARRVIAVADAPATPGSLFPMIGSPFIRSYA